MSEDRDADIAESRSIIAPDHLPIWSAERSSLHRLLDSDSVAPNHRRRLEAELSEVDRVLKRAGR